MSDDLSIGERIYVLLEDLKDLQPDIPQYIVDQAEELHELYNQTKPSDKIDILELRRFYKDLYKTHNLFDLAQEIGLSESSLRYLIYGYHVGDKVLQKCYDYAKKFIGE